MHNTLPIKVHINPDVLFQELDTSSVLLNINSEQYYGLDDVGAQIWQLMNEHTLVLDILTHMLALYDVDETRLESDLQLFIKRLAEAEMLSIE